MLPATSDVRVWNDSMEKTFSLYEDMIVLGVVNGKGVLNKDTLSKIQRITDEILRIKGVKPINSPSSSYPQKMTPLSIIFRQEDHTPTSINRYLETVLNVAKEEHNARVSSLVSSY